MAPNTLLFYSLSELHRELGASLIPILTLVTHFASSGQADLSAVRSLDSCSIATHTMQTISCPHNRDRSKNIALEELDIITPVRPFFVMILLPQPKHQPQNQRQDDDDGDADQQAVPLELARALGVLDAL